MRPKDKDWKMSPAGWKVSNILLGNSRGQLLIAPERMKWLGQSRTSIQLWMSLVVKVKSKVVKEQYYIGIWDVGSMNLGKLGVVKYETARINIDIVGTGELKWTGMGKFNSNEQHIYYCGQESLRRNGVALIINNNNNKNLKCNTWVQSQK